MTDEKSGAQGMIDRAKEDLKRFRDELELKASLAKMEAKKATEHLEPAFKKFEAALDEAGRKLGDTAEKARLQATLAASEARSSWPGLEAAVDHVLSDIKNELKKSADSIDPDKTAADVKAKLSDLKKRLFG